MIVVVYFSGMEFFDILSKHSSGLTVKQYHRMFQLLEDGIHSLFYMEVLILPGKVLVTRIYDNFRYLGYIQYDY